jgi:hypothetical protein
VAARLATNLRKAFVGSYVLGIGFTFDDAAAAKGEAENLKTMRELIESNPHNAERIFPFIGGEEINTSPTHAPHRYVIDFRSFPLRRDRTFKYWSTMSEAQRESCISSHVVPDDYPGDVAADWPELVEIIERRVKPKRLTQGSIVNPERWWMHARSAADLYSAISTKRRVLAVGQTSTHFCFTFLPTGMIYSHKVILVADDTISQFGLLQSRVHETWSRFAGSTMKDDPVYTPTDCYETFPFPEDFETSPTLEVAGQAYHDHRAALMVARDEGMTKTYNRFHDSDERNEDIVRLRDLHAEMDRTVLLTYGWDDLAERSEPIFLDATNEDDHTYQGRLFWPSAFRDEVLAVSSPSMPNATLKRSVSTSRRG